MDNPNSQEIGPDEPGNGKSQSAGFPQAAVLNNNQVHFSPWRFLIIIIGGIFLAEVIAMIFIYSFPHLPYYQQTLIDASIMVILIFPLVYSFSLRPLLLYIEKHQKMENSLRQSEERFALAYRSNPAALSITRVEDRRFIEVNESFLLRSGYARDEVIGHTADELNLYPNPEERDKLNWLLLKQRSVDGFEMTTRIKSGEIRNISISTEAIELDGGVNILAVASDITERRLAQKQVQEMALFPSLNPDALLQVDVLGRIRRSNPAAVQLGLYVDTKLTEIIPDLRNLDLSACISTGRTRQVHEAQLGERALLWTIRGVSKLGLAFLYSTDITERKQAQEKLRQAYDDLELRVQERTAELRIANSELEKEISVREQAESEIQKHAEELHAKNEELSRFNKAMVGRELRMIDLKKEVNELCGKANQPPRYALDFEKERTSSV